MSKYSELELPALIDLLIRHTGEYTRMVSYKVFSVEEFSRCKQVLAEIHTAIKEKSEREGKPINNILPNFPDFDTHPGSSRERSR
jgi:hypothetical protein